MFKAMTFRELIASPGDLAEHRLAATEAIHEWNAQHSAVEGVVLRELAEVSRKNSLEEPDRLLEVSEVCTPKVVNTILWSTPRCITNCFAMPVIGPFFSRSTRISPRPGGSRDALAVGDCTAPTTRASHAAGERSCRTPTASA
jgi:hypothetical protein